MSGHDARRPSGPERDGRDGRTGAGRVGRQRGPRSGVATTAGPGPEVAPTGQEVAVPRDELPTEPVNLAEFADVQGTEALLDRLARREPAEDDLTDPLAGLLVELTRDVDLETDASRRFRAVLAGRTAQDGQWRLEPPSTGPIPQIPGRAAAHRRSALRAAGAFWSGGAFRSDGAAPGGVLREVARNLPALGAAAAVVLAVCGGVVATVTGDPMAPITGINSALSDPQPVSYQQVQARIQSAAKAVRTGDSGKARQLIDKARDEVDRVEAPPQKSALKQQIAVVEQSLASPSPTEEPTSAPVRTPGQTGGPVQVTADPTATATGGTSTATPAPTATGSVTPAPTGSAPVTPPSAEPTPPVAVSPPVNANS